MSDKLTLTPDEMAELLVAMHRDKVLVALGAVPIRCCGTHNSKWHGLPEDLECQTAAIERLVLGVVLAQSNCVEGRPRYDIPEGRPRYDIPEEGTE